MKSIQYCCGSPSYLVHFKHHVCVSVLLQQVSPLLSTTLEVNEVVGVMKEWEVEAQAAGGHSIINDIRIKGCVLCPTYPTDRTLSVTFTLIEIITI
jgi:hypothetical protein